MPPLVTEAAPVRAYESLAAVSGSSAPARDMADLTYRFQGVEAPQVARTTPPDENFGDMAQFWFKNLDRNENERVRATLAYRSDDLNMWFEEGVWVQDEQVAEVAHIIESRILLTDRAFFGREWQPGIDGDERINILHLRQIGGVGAAYFWSGDEYVSAVNPYSNEREMLYVSLKEASLGSDAYFSVIAHEMQHLIQWHTDKNEEAWLNEGMGELASFVNGYAINRGDTYVNNTDIQLTTLSQDKTVVAAHYAAASLFSLYFLDRFGEEATRALVRHPDNGINGFSRILATLGTGMSFDDLFADWLVANYLDGQGRGQGDFQYENLDLPSIKPTRIQRYPAAALTSVSQYGADFYELRSEEPVTIVFTGTQQVKLVDAAPHSGYYFWASSPADESEMTLTRRFDLTEVESASLSFWTWFDIEAGWDYAYVSASANDGRTWKLLETESTTRDNPEGNSLGPGFTGVSGGGSEPVWVRETADLSSFAGRPVQIRFQYVTDGAVHEQGIVIDDLSVPGVAYSDDVENGYGGWQAAGFSRTGNILPQRFILQQLLLSSGDVQVKRLSLDENQLLQWIIPMDNQYNRAILIISGSTPVTRQPAVYAYEISRWSGE